MKTIKQIIKSTPQFHDSFSSEEDVFNNFDCQREARAKYNILYAVYESGWEGSAWVLVTDGKDLFEVHGSHCSCYGLEGQFEPEPVLLPELKNRLEKGHFIFDEQPLIEFLGL